MLQQRWRRGLSSWLRSYPRVAIPRVVAGSARFVGTATGKTGPAVVTHAWGSRRAQLVSPAAREWDRSALLTPTSASQGPSGSWEDCAASVDDQTDKASSPPLGPQSEVEGSTLSREEVLSLVEVCVPTILTSVSQVARQVPDVVMEELSRLPEGRAGLAGYLTSHPSHFAVTHIGRVVVTRRLRAQPRLSASQARAELQRLLSLAPDTSRRPPGGSPMAAPPQRTGAGTTAVTATTIVTTTTTVPQAVRDMIPPFLVPVETLISTWPSSSPVGTECADTVKAFVQQYEKYLRYVNPFSDAPLAGVTDNGGRSDGAALWRRGYLSLHPLYSERSGAPRRGSTGSANTGEPSTSMVSERLAEYEVQDYEWYRVARLFPTANTPTQLNATMLSEARLLLPAHHSVLHVLYSAPHLFQVSVHRPADGAPAEQKGDGGTPACADDEADLCVWVQFVLDPAYAMTVKETPEELAKAYENLKAPTPACGSDRKKPLNRAKRRQLRRKRQYLTNVTPFFDDRVLAVQLLDLMPTSSPVPVSELVTRLPDEARNCLPGNLRAIFSKFPEYFFVFHDGVSPGAVVQRADLPPPAIRGVETINAAEILQEIFTRYPIRSHPECGINLHRCMPVLPYPYQQRILRMHDASEEVLMSYPDKVEILPEGSTAMGALSREAGRAAHLLQETHGRRDLLVPFRFVGEWQERLTQRYESHLARRNRDPVVERKDE